MSDNELPATPAPIATPTDPAAPDPARPADQGRPSPTADPNAADPRVIVATERNPRAHRARQFAREFVPREGVDYTWVEQYAREQYVAFRSVWDVLDNKATTIITTLTSATGLFTLGTIAVVTTAKVPVDVVEWALPTILAAIAAIILAAWSRRPVDIFPPPDPEQMVRMAHDFPGGCEGRALMIPQWFWLTELLRGPLAAKARYVAWATWLMIASLVGLLLPLIVFLHKAHGQSV